MHSSRWMAEAGAASRRTQSFSLRTSRKRGSRMWLFVFPTRRQTLERSFSNGLRRERISTSVLLCVFCSRQIVGRRRRPCTSISKTEKLSSWTTLRPTGSPFTWALRATAVPLGRHASPIQIYRLHSEKTLSNFLTPSPACLLLFDPITKRTFVNILRMHFIFYGKECRVDSVFGEVGNPPR